MYFPTGDSAEAVYEAAFEAGTDTPVAFRARCASYGYTPIKHGTGWDDKCIGHEQKNKLGPFAEPKPEAATAPAVPRWALIGGAIVVAYLLFK